MKRNVLRMIWGAVGIAVLYGAGYALVHMPLWVGMAIGTLILSATVLACAYILGDFILVVFLNKSEEN